MTVALHPATRIRPTVPVRPAQPLRLGLLTPHNPHDRQAFSGTVFHAVRALSRRSDLRLRILGPHRAQTALDRLLRRPSPRFGAEHLRADDFQGLDAVLGLVASPLLDRAATLTDLPLVHVTDATPGFLRDVYGRDVPASADATEARVLGRATPLYSSRHMADRAVLEFGMREAKSLPFGVNFTELPADLPVKPPLDRLELLFVGGDWARKGGALALEAFDALRATGRAAHLTLVGGVPEPVRRALRRRGDITLTGFLDKNRPRDNARLAALYARAHLFVLPTRADCTPMVVAEALAHHTPVLATDVGGIAEMIAPGAGRVLPPGAGAGAWAHAIDDMTADAASYGYLSDGAAERTRTRLNWATWAADVAAVLSETVLEQAARAA